MQTAACRTGGPRRSIEREAALDGVYLIHTSQSDLVAADVVRSYKQLTRVEQPSAASRAWTCGCGRPHHRRERRVRAHLLLCVLAYYVEWHLRQDLAELLIEDEGLAEWQAERDPVEAAQTRPAVQAKKNRRRTAEGLELQSFSTLLEALGMRCRHQ